MAAVLVSVKRVEHRDVKKVAALQWQLVCSTVSVRRCTAHDMIAVVQVYRVCARRTKRKRIYSKCR